MRMMIVAASAALTIFAAAAAASTAAEPSRALDLKAEDRRALVIGLAYRLGGKFIISGLDNAEPTCSETGTCVTTTALLEIPFRNTAIGSLDDLVDNVQIGSDPAVAIVSLQSARWVGRGRLEITAMTYDGSDKRWKRATAVIGNQALAMTGPNMGWRPGRRFIDSWEVSELPAA